MKLQTFYEKGTNVGTVRFNYDEHFYKRLSEVYPKFGAEPLAEEFSVCTETIHRRAKEKDLKSPFAQKKIEIKKSLRENYFETWSTTVAYDLGYIWADGTIGFDTKSKNRRANSLHLYCQQSDESIILGLRDRLGSKHAIRRRNGFHKSGSERRMTSCAICSTVIADSLIKHGMTLAKSKQNLPFPKHIPPELLGHFVRGYFDGDGTVGKYEYSYTKTPKVLVAYLGSPAFIEGFLQTLLQTIPGLSRTKPTRATNYCDMIVTLQWQNRRDISLLRDFMYPAGEYPFLERKRVLVNQCCV